MAILSTFKKTELVSLSTHYKLKVASSTKKVDVQRILTQYLVDEGIVSQEEQESLPDLELRKLEHQEREKERENQLHIKELELREHE